ncbi:hypothetical protein B0H11DRAFT_2024446, partial [Mycena galericulata]
SQVYLFSFAVLLASITALKINHLYFHSCEPKSATLPLLFLIVEPLIFLIAFREPLSFSASGKLMSASFSPWHLQSLSIAPRFSGVYDEQDVAKRRSTVCHHHSAQLRRMATPGLLLSVERLNAVRLGVFPVEAGK